MTEKPDCIASIRTVYIASKIFGCNLFHIPADRHSTEPIRMKAIDYIIAVAYVVLYSIAVIPFFIEMVSKRINVLMPSGNFVVLCLVRLIFCFISIANLSCYIMETVNRKKIWKLLTTLYDFDVQVGGAHFKMVRVSVILIILQAKNLGIKVNTWNGSTVNYIGRISVTLLLMAAACIVMGFFRIDSYWLILQFFATYVTMDGCYTTTLCVFNFFIINFNSRFANINDALRYKYDD